MNALTRDLADTGKNRRSKSRRKRLLPSEAAFDATDRMAQ